MRKKTAKRLNNTNATGPEKTVRLYFGCPAANFDIIAAK